MNKLEESTARFSSSLKAIEDAKRRMIVIDTIPPKNRKAVAGPKKTVVTKADTVEPEVKTDTEKPKVEKKRISYDAPKERKVNKKSNIGKLLKGKKFSFDM